MSAAFVLSIIYVIAKEDVSFSLAMTKLLESSRISPPPCAVADQSLPLTFLDIIWIRFHPIRRLLFYEFPCSNPYFLQTLLPKLKQSLSSTLQHFFTLAGNIVFPLNPDGKPLIRYRAGDAVPLAVFESTEDFDHLVGNHARDADKFYEFIPPLPQVTVDSDRHKLFQALSLQVTLFPGRGVCIGFANHHVAGDASSIVGFMRSWASMNKLGEGDEPMPIFDRSLIKYNPELDTIYLEQTRVFPMRPPSFPLPTNRVRATYVLSPPEIKKLKVLVQAKIPGLVHVSSFVVTAAYVWSCLAKSGKEENGNDDVDFFSFAVDCRARFDPRVPGNYFGNCLLFGLPKIQHQDLVGDEGFVLAAEAIGEEIKTRVNNKEKLMEGAEDWLSRVSSAKQHGILSVSGSARVDLYGADFGWGKARKLETLSIDGEKYAMSLCKSRDFEGGLEVGLSLPKEIMEAFAAYFYDGLKE